jgi:hypothetical protein
MPQSPIVPFRANEKDRERLAFLQAKLKLGNSRIIRLALERLYLSVKWIDKK